MRSLPLPLLLADERSQLRQPLLRLSGLGRLLLSLLLRLLCLLLAPEGVSHAWAEKGQLQVALGLHTPDALAGTEGFMKLHTPDALAGTEGFRPLAGAIYGAAPSPHLIISACDFPRAASASFTLMLATA